MNAVIVGSGLNEESRSTSQSSNSPVPGCRQKKAGDERASIDYERDRVISIRGCHSRINARCVVGGGPTRVFVVSIPQITIQSTAKLRRPDVSHPSNRVRG